MPEGQTMGSRRRSLTVRIAPQSLSPLRCTHGLPTVSPIGDYSLHPSVRTR